MCLGLLAAGDACAEVRFLPSVALPVIGSDYARAADMNKDGKVDIVGIGLSVAPEGMRQ